MIEAAYLQVYEDFAMRFTMGSGSLLLAYQGGGTQLCSQTSVVSQPSEWHYQIACLKCFVPAKFPNCFFVFCHSIFVNGHDFRVDNSPTNVMKAKHQTDE